MSKHAIPALATVAILASGCSAGTPTADKPVLTVTITPTVTATNPRPSATKTPKPAGQSDDVGRKFDLGTIVKVQGTSGMPVLIFDRWSARGVSDSKLASSGVPITVHADAPFQNLNTKNTFRIPVLPGAIFTYSHCVSVDQPAQQRSSTLQEFASLAASEKIVLLTLDAQGRVTRAENDPAC